MTVNVKTIDSQRCICRTHLFEFIGASAGDESRDPREQVDQLSTHHPPAIARAAEVLLLVLLEARLHEREASTGPRGREPERHDGVDVADGPRVAQLPAGVDLEEPTGDDA